MKTPLPLILRRRGLVPRAILVCVLGLAWSAFAACPYIVFNWATSSAVVGDTISGSFDAYDDDGDLVYMEVDFITPEGWSTASVGGWNPPNGYWTGYTGSTYTWQSGQWIVRARAMDSEGNYVEEYGWIWVDTPPPYDP